MHMKLHKRIEELGPFDRLFEVEEGVYTIPRELWDYKRNQLSYQHYLTNTLFPALNTLLGGEAKGLSALDVGCNCGWLSLLLRRYGFDHVTGIEPNLDYLAQAEFLRQATGTKGVEFSNTPLGEVKGRFDVVFMMGVINHTNTPVDFFHKIYDLSNRFLILDFNSFIDRHSAAIDALASDRLDGADTGSIHTRFKEGVTDDGRNHYYFVYEFSKKAIIKHLQEAGFYNVMSIENPVAMPKGYRKRENNVFLVAEKHDNPEYFKEQMALDTCYGMPPQFYYDTNELFDVSGAPPRFTKGYYPLASKPVYAHRPYLKHVYACFAAKNPGASVYAWGVKAYPAFKQCLEGLDIKAFIDRDPAMSGQNVCGIPVMSPESLTSLPPLPLLILEEDKQAIFPLVRTLCPNLDCIP